MAQMGRRSNPPTVADYRKVVQLALVAAVGTVALRELLRRREGRLPAAYWDTVRSVALGVAGKKGVMSAQSKKEVSQIYNALADELGEHFFDEEFGLTQVELPPFVCLDRQDWIEANIAIAQNIITPLENKYQLGLPNILLFQIGNQLGSAYVGLVLGYMSKRVLGQYDPEIMQYSYLSKGKLYLVEPNIVAWEAKATSSIDPRNLRKWLILHEQAHAWQFIAHPWVKQTIESDIEKLAQMQQKEITKALLANIRDRSKRMSIISEVLDLTTLLEGHSMFVMNHLGSKLITNYDQIRSEWEKRARNRTPLEKIVANITGVIIKLRQYDRGLKFFESVYNSYGKEGLIKVWETIDSFPRGNEIDNPTKWWQRVNSI